MTYTAQFGFDGRNDDPKKNAELYTAFYCTALLARLSL